jgi:hypothetical protein
LQHKIEIWLLIKEDAYMKNREGLIPTVLGAAVTATAATAAATKFKSKDTASMVAAGIAGFGLAHIVLGAIDLVEHR